MLRKIATLSLALAVVLLTCIWAPQQAHANNPDDWQFSGQDFATMSDFFSSPKSPISRSDLDLFAERLQLTEDQMSFVGDRYDALVTDYRQQWLDFAEQRTDARYSSQISGDWEEMQRQMSTYRAEQEQIAETIVDDFMNDLRIVLTPEQDAQWTAMERDRLRRETLTKYTCFDAERFDLVEIVRMLQLSDEHRAPIAPILDRYAQTLHPLLESRNRKIEAAASAYEEMQNHNFEYSMAMRDSEEYDEQKQLEFAERQQTISRNLVVEALAARESSGRIRDINIQFRNEIQRILPDDALEEFTKLTNPKPRTSMENWWSEYSRAGQVISTLENLEATKAMMTSYAANMGDNEEMQGMMMLMQAAEPLSASQKRSLEDIKLRLKDQRERIKERYAAKRETNTRPDNEENSFSVNTPAGALRFRRITDDSNQFNMWSGGDDDDSNFQQEMGKELNKVEQDIINEVRAMLSTRQRMAVANF